MHKHTHIYMYIGLTTFPSLRLPTSPASTCSARSVRSAQFKSRTKTFQWANIHFPSSRAAFTVEC